MGHFRQIDPLPTLSACPLRPDRVRTFAPQRFDAGRVEDGRGSLGHAATLRFPSPLIEPDVRISCIRLSDWLHREAHGASDQGRRSRRSTPRSP
jgi:hypothetical protein